MIDLKSAFEAMWNRKDTTDNQVYKVGNELQKIEEQRWK